MGVYLSGALSNGLSSVLLLISFCLAWLTYQFIEKPIRFSLRGRVHAFSTAKILGLFLVVTGGIAFIVYKQHGLESRYIAQTKKSFTEDINNFELYRTNLQACKTTNQQVKKLDWCLQTRQGAPNAVRHGRPKAEARSPR